MSLVTGATGAMGRSVVTVFVSEGVKVCAVIHGAWAANLSAQVALVVVPAFAPADAPAEQIQQIRQATWGPLAPWSSGAYGNFLSEASVAAAYPGEPYTRLARIKAIYDPENLFNQNLNFPPASTVQA